MRKVKKKYQASPRRSSYPNHALGRHKDALCEFETKRPSASTLDEVETQQASEQESDENFDVPLPSPVSQLPSPAQRPIMTPTPSTSSSGASKKRKQMDVVDNVIILENIVDGFARFRYDKAEALL
ncbi:hypothetical protein Pcinc_008198 [Petrolisthes cinctipes]|uniref:Uncharacterized protein n=1 Tax=Petrolisthes cinctipes TaxID=88211 RepID=A0AAE1G6Z7_PETCI|nr:hypothetical protein Pcinc_008198 [Petrolisthes cinctipes]